MEQKTKIKVSEKALPNWLAVVFAVLAIVSIFLPWIDNEADRFNMIGTVRELVAMRDMEPMLILMYVLYLIPIAAVLSIVSELNRKSEKKILSLVARIVLVVVAAISLFSLMRIQSELADFGGSIWRLISIGYWIMIASSVFILISLFYKPSND